MPYSPPQDPNATPLVPVIPTKSGETSAHSAPDYALVSCVIMAMALSLILIALGYKQYCARRRSRLLKRQVAMLEAMWRISSRK